MARELLCAAAMPPQRAGVTHHSLTSAASKRVATARCGSAASLSLVLLLFAACGDEQADTPPVACTRPRAERYLPLVVGGSWTYDVSEAGKPAQVKKSTVEAIDGGTTTFRVKTEKLDGATLSWQEDRCDQVLRLRERNLDATGAQVSEQRWQPGKLRVDETAEHVALGASWTTQHSQVETLPSGQTKTTTKSETWTVVAVDEAVTVPAGTFETLRVRKVTSGNADKTFWFARGVGKIKEQGEQTEELRAYTLPDE